ncbi:unconventional prefoldin RPB5 interactor [Lasioglossum baleicum]|uniref:unconventional prefoldin RPB5 interactor n=1 Tax=Lasioglossum baleicum TaxID=434251 RepID=UPI003FCE8430
MYDKQDILDLVFTKGIERNEEQRKIWTNYKRGHQKVAEALFTFRKDVYVNCMVPVGKKAFLKGKLIHTNEVLASLGNGYFAKYSADGAAALCERRIKHAEEMLKNLSGEIDLYETRMMAMENNLFGDCAGSEIVEHWNEEEIQEWKVKHREREREYRQKLAKLRQEKKPKVETEEDLIWRLDQLELEEELEDECNRQSGLSEHSGEELEEYSYESESSEVEEEHSEEAKQQNEKEQEEEGNAEQLKDEEEKGRQLQNEEEEKQLKNEEEEKQLRNEAKTNQIKEVKAAEVKKCVSFVQLDDVSKQKDKKSKEKTESSEEVTVEDILRIEFSHSENVTATRSEEDSIETPADIYRIYSKPKSILKRSPNDIPLIRDAPPDYSTEEEEDEFKHVDKPSAYESIVKDITERDTSKIVEIVPEIAQKTRPVSKFKRDRQHKR